MAPGGPRVFINWFRGSYFISAYKVNANFRCSRLYFLIGKHLQQPTCRQIASRPQLISFLFVARKTTASRQEDIPSRCMEVCHTGLRERDKYSR